MTITVTLRCQGKRGRCTQVLERATRNSTTVRTAARRAGWVCPDGDSGDLCPSCVPASMPRACYRCTSAMPFADALGHDKTGHRTANVLDLNSIRTWEDLLDLRPHELHRMIGIGKQGFDRVQRVQLDARRKKAA